MIAWLSSGCAEVITIFMEYAFNLSIDLYIKTKMGHSALPRCMEVGSWKSDTDSLGECSSFEHWCYYEKRLWFNFKLLSTNYILKQTWNIICTLSDKKTINLSLFHKSCFVSISRSTWFTYFAKIYMLVLFTSYS